VSYTQERNFGLKVGVPIQKKNEAPLGPEVRGGNGEEVSISHPTMGSGKESSALPAGSRAAAANGFIVI